MTDQSNREIFLALLFEHSLSIAKGKCSITLEMLEEWEDEAERNVLEGLLLLHEDRQLQEQELLEAQANKFEVQILEEKNKQLEQFNFAVSHDLKEPLRTISGFAALLLKKHKGILDDKAVEYLEFITGASNRMWDLINGLLNYTSLGQSRGLSEINVSTLVDEICLDLDAVLKTKNVQLKISPLPRLQGFEIEMRQLFQNLISNAIKFSKENHLNKIEIGSETKSNETLFYIKDQGIGIPAHLLMDVFEIFKRINRKDQFEGSGIGLALCKKIVTLHNGEIWVDSNIGTGSTFYFTISHDIQDA